MQTDNGSPWQIDKMSSHVSEENQVQNGTSNLVDDEDEDLFRVESDIVDTPDMVNSRQPVKALKGKPTPNGRGRPTSTKSSQSATTAKKLAKDSTPTIVRMEELVEDEDDSAGAVDIDVEFPRLSEIKSETSTPSSMVPKKRGRPAKDNGGKVKVFPTKKPRGRPPTKRIVDTENKAVQLVRKARDQPAKSAINDMYSSTSSAAEEIKPPEKSARKGVLAANEDVDVARPSRAAAESAKSNITIQSTNKQLYRTEDVPITSSTARDNKGTTAGRSRGRPPKKQSGQSIFAVEKLVGFKLENGVKLYHVKWAKYGASENTWEPLKNLEGCKNLVAAFDKKHSKSKSEPKKN